jgi:hypothetical protein
MFYIFFQKNKFLLCVLILAIFLAWGGSLSLKALLASEYLELKETTIIKIFVPIFVLLLYFMAVIMSNICNIEKK